MLRAPETKADGVNASDPVTVVVCSRDRPERLADCLAAVNVCLRQLPDGRRDELVVVDSASADGRTAEVAAAAGARVVRVEQPGLSRARNAGLAAAATEAVAFTDDDCRPRPGWVEAIATAFASDDRIAFVTGRVEADGGGAPTVLLDAAEPRVLDVATPLDEMGHGANMSVRVAAVREVGGYDDLLGAGAWFRAGEDSDMYQRLVAAGWIGRYEPAAAVGHEQWRSRWAAVRMAYGYGLGFGAVASKAARQDRERGQELLRHGLGSAGLGRAWHDLRTGYQLGVLVCLSWTVGVAIGHRRAQRMPINGATLDGSPPPRARDRWRAR